MIKFLDLNRQHRLLQDEINNAISNVVADSAFVGGAFVKTFETEFARYLGAQYCVGVGNGTDAIEIALESLELEPGSEVIVPANTFIATSEAVTRSGLNVVFADVDQSYNIDIDDLTSKISTNTSAVIAVHLFGRPCQMDALASIVTKYKLKLIEDCSQAHGAKFKGKKIGTFGDISTFSFYPGKNLGAFGDAGAIVTNSEDLADRCRQIANHGRTAKYDHEFEGRNSRLDSIHAAVLSVKLRHLDFQIELRNNVAHLYYDLLDANPHIELPSKDLDIVHAYHLFVIQLTDRDQLQDHLVNSNIQTGIHYPIALPLLNAYRHLREKYIDLRANTLCHRILSLPMDPYLSKEEIQTVCNQINRYFNLDH